MLCCADGDLMQYEELLRRNLHAVATTEQCISDNRAALALTDASTESSTDTTATLDQDAAATAMAAATTRASPPPSPPTLLTPPTPPPAALILLIEGGAGAWWSSFGGLVDRWMAAQAQEEAQAQSQAQSQAQAQAQAAQADASQAGALHPVPYRVLAALFVSDAPADSDSANGVMEQVEASALEHRRSVLRDLTVPLMNGARRYLFVTCVVTEEAGVADAEAGVDVDAEAEAGPGPGAGDLNAASKKMAAWESARGRVT